MMEGINTSEENWELVYKILRLPDVMKSIDLETAFNDIIKEQEGQDKSVESADKKSYEDIVWFNIQQDKVYYQIENTIYEVSKKYFENKINEIEKSNTQIQQEEQETKPYEQGNVSYDAYDVGDFSTELRNKTDEDEKRGVYYEIFVRSFADSDGDGIGDFNGICEKLDYLKELGIEGIWLMPVNQTESYHGYDITDYMALNEEYGTEEDFQNLIDEVHKRGMKIIMDFPINHTSSSHVWFVEALEDENSEYRNYYRWVHKNDNVDFGENDESAWGSQVWHKNGDSYYYAMFSGNMPDLNYNNPKVREEIKKAAGKWIEMGVDGYRLDAAMHIYGQNEFKQEENPTQSTIDWWNELALYLENINPNVYLVGEAWQNDEILEAYVQPFDTKFNFSLQEKLLDSVCMGTALTDEGENLAVYLQNMLNVYDEVDTNYLDGVFGSNHDQNRIMSSVDDEKKARQVALVYMTLPGNPYIYYGEELGMKGEKPDEYIRTPFLWSEDSSYNTTWIEDEQNEFTVPLEEQMNDEKSMYSFYKNIIALRKENQALYEGDFVADDLGNDYVMAYTRNSETQSVLVLHNLSKNARELDLQEYAVEEILLKTDEMLSISEGKITLEGNDSVVLLLK